MERAKLYRKLIAQILGAISIMAELYWGLNLNLQEVLTAGGIPSLLQAFGVWGAPNDKKDQEA